MHYPPGVIYMNSLLSKQKRDFQLAIQIPFVNAVQSL